MGENLGFLQRLTRLYTFYSPIRRGKYRLADLSLGLAGKLPEQIVCQTLDGRRLRVNFDTHFAQYLYFLGEYEPAVTNILKSLIKPGDICFDVGANIGWYTTLFQTLVGSGEVHAFEPTAETFKVLKENVESNLNSRAVHLNRNALGEVGKEVNIHIFKNKGDGHASIADFGESDYILDPVEMITLNSYIDEKGIENVKFVKVDIEGAELAFLNGATRLFDQDRPPIFEIEMALDTTRGFGYLPNDLIRFIAGRRDYDFWAIDEDEFVLKQIYDFEPADRGANVLCMPTGHFPEIAEKLKLMRLDRK